MAFASTITQRPIAAAPRRMSWGTFTSSAGGIGGDIDTGLRSCENIILQQVAAAVVADAPVVNETLPVAGNAVTIVTTTDAAGIWIAWGY